jgi:hypothetical protein
MCVDLMLKLDLTLSTLETCRASALLPCDIKSGQNCPYQVWVAWTENACLMKDVLKLETCISQISSFLFDYDGVVKKLASLCTGC